MTAEIMGFYVVNGVINLINSQLARQATEKLEDKRQEFQKWQQLNNQEFQREQFEKQKQLQKELAEDNRQTQLKVALEQRNTARQIVQDQKLFQNWPLRIVPDQILNANHDENLISLRIIPAPPVIDFDQFGGNNKSFPNIETGLAQGLREFFNQHYSFQSTERPIELIDGGWDSKRYHGGAAIIGLFALLKSEPMLILESQIDGDYLHLNVGYWGEGQQKYFYQSIISNLPYREVVYESVKIRARQWREKREQLAKQLNKSLEEIDRQYGSDNAFNLKILQDEEALKSAGIDSSDLATQPYKVTAKDFEYLCQFLVKCQSLVGGWIADIHYLIHHNVPPILPKLIPDLMRGIDDPKLLKTIVSGYRQVYEALENERPAWMPELALDLADSLTALPDKNWAREQLDYSVKSWLRLRGINKEGELESLLGTLGDTVALGDIDYVEKLEKILFIVKADKLGYKAIFKKLYSRLDRQKKEQQEREKQKKEQQQRKKIPSGSSVKLALGGKAKIFCPRCGRINNISRYDQTINCSFCGCTINVAARKEELFFKEKKIKCPRCRTINIVRNNIFNCNACGCTINASARTNELFD